MTDSVLIMCIATACPYLYELIYCESAGIKKRWTVTFINRPLASIPGVYHVQRNRLFYLGSRAKSVPLRFSAIPRRVLPVCGQYSSSSTRSPAERLPVYNATGINPNAPPNWLRNINHGTIARTRRSYDRYRVLNVLERVPIDMFDKSFFTGYGRKKGINTF